MIIDQIYNSEIEYGDCRRRASSRVRGYRSNDASVNQSYATINYPNEALSTLLFAAMDTTSSALARILHLLAQHPKAQERLRKEVTDARQDEGDLTYDDLVALPFLDAVIRETLRL